VFSRGPGGHCEEFFFGDSVFDRGAVVCFYFLPVNDDNVSFGFEVVETGLEECCWFWKFVEDGDEEDFIRGPVVQAISLDESEIWSVSCSLLEDIEHLR